MHSLILDTVSAVKNGVIQARFLTGVYLLQSNRHVFSNKTVDPNCRLCQLGVEDIHHVVTRYPAYHNIRTLTTSQLKNIIIDIVIFVCGRPTSVTGIIY